jgi:hypothetical protein
MAVIVSASEVLNLFSLQLALPDRKRETMGDYFQHLHREQSVTSKVQLGLQNLKSAAVAATSRTLQSIAFLPP